MALFSLVSCLWLVCFDTLCQVVSHFRLVVLRCSVLGIFAVCRYSIFVLLYSVGKCRNGVDMFKKSSETLDGTHNDTPYGV